MPPNLVHQQCDQSMLQRTTSRISHIQSRYGRDPTANELLALANLPCVEYSQSYNRGHIGQCIHRRLRYFEESGDVSVLEEAGRLLRLEISGMAPPPGATAKQTAPPPSKQPENAQGSQSKHEGSSVHQNFNLEEFKPFIDEESAEIARMNEEMLGGGSL